MQDAEHFLRTREFSRTALNAGGAAGRGAREEPEEDYEHEIMERREEDGDNVDEEHDMMMEIQREMEEEEREHRRAQAPALPGHLARQHQVHSSKKDRGGQPPSQQQSTEERVSEEEWAMLAMLEQTDAAPNPSLEEDDAEEEHHGHMPTATSSWQSGGEDAMQAVPEDDKRGECEEGRERATDDAGAEKSDEADDGYDPATSGAWSLGDLDL